MRRFFLFFPMILGDFDLMESTGPGTYYGLWKRMCEAGAGAFYFERHLGVWLILIAVSLLALSAALHSSTIQQRVQIKERTVRTVLIIALFFGLAGFITIVLKAGFDY